MKIRSLLVAGVMGLIVSGPASAFFIDLGGVTADGAGFNIFTVENSNSNAVVDVNFDFVYQTNPENASWGSEVVMQLYHYPSGAYGLIGTQFDGCDAFGVFCDFDLMWDQTGGTFYGSGSFTLNGAVADGSGTWEILIADSFDDSGIDGTFLDGSYINVNQVPAPAPLALLGIGLAGMGLLRSRRKKSPVTAKKSSRTGTPPKKFGGVFFVQGFRQY